VWGGARTRLRARRAAHAHLRALISCPLCSNPRTGVPLVLGIGALTKLIGWTLNAMLGLDPSVDF
jgi:hypothetical protein